MAQKYSLRTHILKICIAFIVVTLILCFTTIIIARKIILNELDRHNESIMQSVQGYEADFSMIYQSLDNLTFFVITVCTIASALMIWGIIQYFKKAEQELYYLQNRTNKIIKGDFEFVESPINQFSFDELKELNSAFSEMKNKIREREQENKRINENLEKIVTERTHQLEEINTQLEEEIYERQLVEEELNESNKNLDQQVEERTKELELLNKALIMSVEQAEKTNREKSKFLSIMSHEMRTPLNGIIGFVQMLEKEPLNESQKETLSIIKNSSKVLLNIINDLLDVAKYEAGKMTFDNIAFNLKNTIQKSIIPFKKIAENQSLEFYYEVEDSLSTEVIGDPFKLTQVLNNLLNNALKFTIEGSIKVIATGSIMGDYINITISVTDTGIGIKDDFKKYIFKPFSQAEDSVISISGGTGLGLTICKKIVSYYKGNIDFESKYNEGTTFTFTMSLKLALNSQLSEENVEEPGQVYSYLKDSRILIAEDNLVNQLLMKKFLSRYNISFDIANNGAEAIELCEVNNYDVIFMDCQMPEIDGFEATRQIRKILGEQVLIVAMTAYVSKSDKEKCLSAVMNEFLSKPVNLDDIARILKIDEFTHTDEKLNKENNKNTNHKDIAARDLAEKIGFDYETCVELINTFVKQATTGLQEIETFIENEDYKNVIRIVHQLKGASGTIRLENIFKLLQQAEGLLVDNKIHEGIEIITRLRKEPILA